MQNRDKELGQENIAKVAYEVLKGEILAGSGNLKEGIEHLKIAVSYEDELPYDEPAVWYIPTRQHLGRLLLNDKQFAEAEEVYRQDLEYYRLNGWSLTGLYQSLIGQGKLEEGAKTKDAFNIAWENADIEISSSVM